MRINLFFNILCFVFLNGVVFSSIKKESVLIEQNVNSERRQLSGSYGAYSLRQLYLTYQGPLIRVRRSKDDNELDFTFDASGYLDVNAVSSFVGTKSTDMGYLTVWYDQNEGEAMICEEIDRQPLVVIDGVLVKTETELEHPAIYFKDSEDNNDLGSTYLTTPDRSTEVSSIDYRLSVVVQKKGGNGELQYAGVDSRGRPHEGCWFENFYY